MDLLKMHPMARKMTAHNEAFGKAIEDGNANDARQHLNEILKYAANLETDLDFVVTKSETEVVTPENGWEHKSPVLKFNKTGSNFDPSMRDRQLKGTIISARTNTTMRPARGTFGRYSPGK
tara:strand:+ start:2473 stop:2835 length:363 start_codon:yes stop_codon:yes gene_type:complete